MRQDKLTRNIIPSEQIAKGKTKEVWSVKGHPGLAIIKSLPDITAGNGARHDIIHGKEVLANRTTCNVFDMLKRRNMPLAYKRELGTNSFLATRCAMLPYEVVVRQKAWGSYCKRHPDVAQGTEFRIAQVEFFLKTTNQLCRGYRVLTDDPLIHFDPGRKQLRLYIPDVEAEDPFDTVCFSRIAHQSETWEMFSDMATIARQVSAHVRRAWEMAGGELIDMKMEFGLAHNQNQTLLVADVIDNDSWRVLVKGEHVDKQRYRDGGDLVSVKGAYELVAKLTKNFAKTR